MLTSNNEKLKLVLPLPISNNKYLYPKRVGNYMRLAESADSKRWKKKVAPIIKKEIEKQNWITTPRGIFVDVHADYFFDRKGQDPNNYLKVLYDIMENCGVYENDDMAKPQTGLVVIDKFNPRIELTITINKQLGAFKDEEARNLFIKSHSNILTEKELNKLLKQLDDNRVAEDVEFDNNFNIYYKENTNGI